jgi:hypothetical protein
MPKCKLCGAEVIRSPLAMTGAILDLDAAEAEPRAGVVAYNEETSLGHVLRTSDIQHFKEWGGITYHRTHAAVCPQTQSWGRPIRSVT